MNTTAADIRPPWDFLNPTAWFDAWRTWAPTGLTQPILPDWRFGPTITVNENNSSAPLTEAAIVQQQSYGRQIGTVMDALQALIENRDASDDERIVKFRAMADEIEAIKQRASRAGADRLRSELAALRRASPADYARLARELVRAEDDAT